MRGRKYFGGGVMSISLYARTRESHTPDALEANLEQGPETSITNKIPGNTDAASSEVTLWK